MWRNLTIQKLSFSTMKWRCWLCVTWRENLGKAVSQANGGGLRASFAGVRNPAVAGLALQ